MLPDLLGCFRNVEGKQERSLKALPDEQAGRLWLIPMMIRAEAL
jgi:hypothetical protein